MTYIFLGISKTFVLYHRDVWNPMDLLSPKIRKPNHNLPISINSPYLVGKKIVGYATVSLLPIRYFYPCCGTQVSTTLIERVYERKFKESFTVTLYRKMIYQATRFSS
jgi:hypothetical protein